MQKVETFKVHGCGGVVIEALEQGQERVLLLRGHRGKFRVEDDLEHPFKYLRVFGQVEGFVGGLTQVVDVVGVPGYLVDPGKYLETLNLLVVAVPVQLEDTLCLNGIGDGLGEFPEIETQKGQLEEDDCILGNVGLVMFEEDVFGLVVLLEGLVFPVYFEVDVAQLVVLVSKGQRVLSEQVAQIDQ